MNLFPAIGRFFLNLGALIVRGLRSARVRGLTDAVVERALAYVRTAADRTVDNAERREWAVQMLIARLHIPESVARVAVEIAVQIYKEERATADEG